MDCFVQELVRNSITGHKISKKGSVKFKFNYKLHSLQGNDKKISVCRKAFTAIYGISKDHINRCSQVITMYITYITYSYITYCNAFLN